MLLQLPNIPNIPIPFTPEQASTFASSVDGLYLYLVLWTVLIVGLVVLLVTFFTVRFQRRSPNEVPQPVAGSVILEGGSAFVLFIVFITFFVWGASVYFAQYRVPQDALEVSVVGKQWMWKLQHPTGEREINELHVPIGRKVKLTMTTEDTLHSFYVPAFRMKMDVVPGRFTNAWFEATKTGRFRIFCAEYCGTNHSGMGGWVEVMEPEAYQEWLGGNANQESPLAAGQQLYQSQGCNTCHGANAEGGRCPPLVGLFGKQVQFADGTTATADESYIRESIINPAAKIVQGYPNIMPTYQGQLTEEQLLQLVSYIKSLAPAQTDGINATAPARSNNPQTGVATPEVQGTNPLSATAPSSSQGGSSTGSTNSRVQRPESIGPAGGSTGGSTTPQP